MRVEEDCVFVFLCFYHERAIFGRKHLIKEEEDRQQPVGQLNVSLIAPPNIRIEKIAQSG